MILCLLYLPAVRLPTLLARACVSIAAATYHIYLFGGFAPRILDGLFGWTLPPGLQSGVAVASGVGLGLALFWAQRAGGRSIAVYLSQARLGRRDLRLMSRV